MSAFELVTSTSAPPSLTDIMGLWRPAVADPDDQVVFGAEGVPRSIASPTLWRVMLPDLADATDAKLDQANTRLAAALGNIERLDTAAGRGTLRAAAIIRNFAMDIANVGAHIEACLAFLATARGALRRDAVIETLIADRRVGWSRVPLMGSVETVVSAAPDCPDPGVHLKAVDLSLRSRAAMMRMLVVLIRCAGILITAMSSPLGPVLGLAAAWRLVNGSRWSVG